MVLEPNFEGMTPIQFVEYFKKVNQPHFEQHYRYGMEWIKTADTKAIISWLRQGTWNEWAAAAVVARLVKDYAEYVDHEFYPLFARQVSDEARHWLLRHRLLQKYGGNMENFTPMEEWIQVFELPIKLALDRPEFFQLRFTSVLQVVEWTSVSHHRGVEVGAGDNHPEIRAVFRELLDDELFHWSIAERTWLKLCKTPEAMRDVFEITQKYTLPIIDKARKRRVELSMRHEL
ncbi:MAG: hypothetical protein NZ921_01500 [Candidatus Caldarchaeum sp.]|nr:hypothetical protein [Candidatus Caldarchaeum sp.]